MTVLKVCIKVLLFVKLSPVLFLWTTYVFKIAAKFISRGVNSCFAKIASSIE